MANTDCNPETNHGTREAHETHEKIVEKYLDLVYKICLTKLYNVDKSSVADACQEVFLNYLKENREFKNERHEKSWFIRTALNCCANFYKKNKRRLLYEESADISEFNISAGGGFESAEGDPLYNILSLLPEKISSAVYLFYIEGYSTEEVAEILKTTGAGVRMRLKRGRDILRNKLGNDELLFNREDRERSKADV
jgi:RNA polymerase sigma-70 factor (ECF subfamily)